MLDMTQAWQTMLPDVRCTRECSSRRIVHYQIWKAVEQSVCRLRVSGLSNAAAGLAREATLGRAETADGAAGSCMNGHMYSEAHHSRHKVCPAL